MTAIDDFLISSRHRVDHARFSASEGHQGSQSTILVILAEIHSVLTVIAQNLPVNVEANKRSWPVED